MNDDSDDNLASIDLAVTFFACLTMFFAFITFTFTSDPPRQDLPVTGQTVATVTAPPSSWSALVRRGAHGVLREGHLEVMSSEAAARSIEDAESRRRGDMTGVSVHLRGRGIPAPPAPNAFVLDLSLDPGEWPEGWLQASIEPGPDADCAMPPRSLLTVWVDGESGRLDALLGWAERCRLDLRYEHLRRTDTGRLSIPIGLHPGAYSLATIFR